MECPICGKKATLKKEKREREFRGEMFTLYEMYYFCEDCKESMTTTEVDEKNIAQIYNQYREKHGILFPEEITLIREKYGLSKRKMSLILGWGENTYALYEKGAMPNESHSNLLELIKDPEQFRKIVKKSIGVVLTEKEADKIFKSIDILTGETIDEWSLITQPESINRFTGYKKPDIEKLAHMILFFLNHNVNYLVRLNKHLFYSDFHAFKTNLRSISGYIYAAIPMGPVLDHYKTIFDYLETQEYFSTEPSFTNESGSEIEKLIPEKPFDPSLFTENEIEIMERIANHFRGQSVKEIVEFSHQEPGWIENEQNRDWINYQEYAPKLQLDLGM